MDDFSAKKSRAQKLRQDKYHHKPKKRSDSGSHGGRGNAKDFTQVKVLAQKEMTDENENGGQKVDMEEIEPQTRLFSRRKLVSNWDRYEETVVNRFEEDDNDTGTLFEELLSMPISGGHLKLKHEQEWGIEKSELQMPWFQLDIQAVEKNLSTIPFCYRQNLPRCIFSENRLLRMTNRAEQNAAFLPDVHESILRIQGLSVSSHAKKDVNSKGKSTTDLPVTDNGRSGTQKRPTGAEDNCNENKDLDNLLVLEDRPLQPETISHVEPIIDSVKTEDALLANSEKVELPPTSPATTVTKPSVSLDDWLDSILDD